MSMKMVHAYGEYIDLYYGDQQLFRYRYDSVEDGWEAPRPYFHPMYTLSGDLATIFRPHDHRWHHGLSMTFAYLSGDNFWGGNSYVHGEGYKPLDNLGQQLHDGWDDVVCEKDWAALKQRIRWVSSKGETWLQEQRHMTVTEINPEKGYWCLDFGTRLLNVRGKALEFGSPTTEGRPNAGYGGLFWRGPRDMSGGGIIMSNGEEADRDEENVMGKRSDWVAVVSPRDGVDHGTSMVFVDQEGNPRYPNKWFVRVKDYACASFAFMFDELYMLNSGDELTLNYRVILGNTLWTRDQIKAVVG